MTRSEYVFDNSGQQARTRFEALAALCDPGTIRYLEERRITEGWHCLEVGGGGGTIAAWLCERVGPAGHVLATDIDPRFLDSLNHRNLEVRRHDIRLDPLPENAFDLVHARLVLMHLPERQSVLERLVRALKPGGWIVAEEFDPLSFRADLADGTAPGRLKTGIAMSQIMAGRGVDLLYGRSLYSKLNDCGLADVGTEGRVTFWRGMSSGAALMRANFEQLRNELLESGLVSEVEFEQDLNRLGDADFVTPSPIMWAAWGRR